MLPFCSPESPRFIDNAARPSHLMTCLSNRWRDCRYSSRRGLGGWQKRGALSKMDKTPSGLTRVEVNNQAGECREIECCDRDPHDCFNPSKPAFHDKHLNLVCNMQPNDRFSLLVGLWVHADISQTQFAWLKSFRISVDTAR